MSGKMEWRDKAQLFGWLQLNYFAALLLIGGCIGGTIWMYVSSADDPIVKKVGLASNNGVWFKIIVMATGLTIVALCVELILHLKFCLLIIFRENPNKAAMKSHDIWYIGTTGALWRLVAVSLYLLTLLRFDIFLGVNAVKIVCFSVGFVIFYGLSFLAWIYYVQAAYSIFSQEQEDKEMELENI